MPRCNAFEQIRDRILGERANNDTSGPRAKAYTNPAIPIEGSRTATLPWGMSPTAITDVISRVTQAASKQGAATRAAVAKKTDPLPTEVAKTVPMETEPVELTINVPKQTVPMGSMLGAFAGGRIAEAYGWRTAFYAVGLPGIALALVLLFVVREPKRGGLDAVVDGGEQHPPPPPLGAAIASIVTNRTLMLTAVSSALSAFVGYAGLLWNPQFLENVKGMTGKEVADYY